MEKNFKRVRIVLAVLVIAITAVMISVVFIPQNYAQADTATVGSGEKYYYTPQTRAARATSQETINYTSYNVVMDSEITTPTYYNTNSSLTNYCGSIGGANIIGFYDCDYTNLIPNYDPAIIRGGKRIFKGTSSYSQNVVNDLYSRMGTNTSGAGVTQSQFESGLKSYINSVGYGATLSNVAINANAIKSNLDIGKPIICFSTISYFINSIDIGTSATTLNKTDLNANHIMIINGIKQVEYYQNGTNFRTDTYLKVAMGLQASPSAYVLMSSLTLDDLATLAIN